MTHLQISESFCEQVNRLREELLELSRGAQLILDNTGAYLVTEGYAINLGGPTSDEVVQQENDMLLPYVLDTITAPEEVRDLTEAVFDHDITGLLSVATDPDNPNGQRVNAYRRLGEYISAFQETRTATSIKHELQGYSHQNGSRTYQIAQRIRSLTVASQNVATKESSTGHTRLDLQASETGVRKVIKNVRRNAFAANERVIEYECGVAGAPP